MREILKQKASEIGVHLDEIAVTRLLRYKELLLHYNNQLNLTSIVEPYQVIIKHFVDSMTAMSLISSGSSVVDVGSGAGFPGMVIAIVAQNSQVTLIDSLKKRVAFLDKVITELNLDNVRALHVRAEDGAKELRESFDIGVARAVSSLPTLIEYIVPYLKVEGKMIAFKGAQEEVKQSQTALKELRAEIVEVKRFLLDSEYKRSLVVVKKKAISPTKYPRTCNKAKKMPL